MLSEKSPFFMYTVTITASPHTKIITITQLSVELFLFLNLPCLSYYCPRSLESDVIPDSSDVLFVYELLLMPLYIGALRCLHETFWFTQSLPRICVCRSQLGAWIFHSVGVNRNTHVWQGTAFSWKRSVPRTIFCSVPRCICCDYIYSSCL